jgi:hypothetical protein
VGAVELFCGEGYCWEVFHSGVAHWFTSGAFWLMDAQCPAGYAHSVLKCLPHTVSVPVFLSMR